MCVNLLCELQKHNISLWHGVDLQDSVFQKLPQMTKLLSAFCKGSANCGLWGGKERRLKNKQKLFTVF